MITVNRNNGKVVIRIEQNIPPTGTKVERINQIFQASYDEFMKTWTLITQDNAQLDADLARYTDEINARKLAKLDVDLS